MAITSPFARPAALAALALAALALAGASLAAPLAAQDGPARDAAAAEPRPAQVRVEATIVLLDREALQRLGVEWVQAGGGRVQRVEHGRRAQRGDARVTVDALPVAAALEVARREGVVRSESRMQLLTLDGAPASVGSGALQLRGPYGVARTTGPELVVTPTVLADGRVRLAVRARLRDEVRGPWTAADGSPVEAATTVIVTPGEPATIGSLRTSTDRRDVGLLDFERRSGEQEVLVVLRADVVRP